MSNVNNGTATNGEGTATPVTATVTTAIKDLNSAVAGYVNLAKTCATTQAVLMQAAQLKLTIPPVKTMFHGEAVTVRPGVCFDLLTEIFEFAHTAQMPVPLEVYEATSTIALFLATLDKNAASKGVSTAVEKDRKTDVNLVRRENGLARFRK